MAQVAQQVREIQGVSIPPAGEYTIDPTHTSAAFVARHLLSKVRGTFPEVEGTITIGDAPERSSVSATIQTASVTSGSAQRDEHLRSPDFFEVEAYPTIGFASTALRLTGGSTFELDGELTIRGVTRPVTLSGTFLGWGPDMMGNDRLFAEASVRVNREDWGLTWNAAVELTGILVAKEVELEISVQAFRPTSSS